jgi:broad specificity phosphatase PhoE
LIGVNKMRVILIRHGESFANKKGIIQGHKDYPLTEKGKKQAKSLAKQIKEMDYSFSALYSSDLNRAKTTAEIIAQILQIPNIFFDRRLREHNLGIYEGRYSKELEEKDKELFDACFADHSKRFPKGESVEEMKKRIRAAFEEITNNPEEKRDVIIVAHGGTLYHILHHILDVFPETDEWFDNCSLNELVYNSDNCWKLQLFNNKELKP